MSLPKVAKASSVVTVADAFVIALKRRQWKHSLNANIRLDCKGLSEKNTLAYFVAASIKKEKKSFVKLLPGTAFQERRHEGNYFCI